MTRSLLSILPALLLLLCSAQAETPPVAPLHSAQPGDPQFMERFSYTWLPDPATEPEISREEQSLFKQLAPLVTNSPRQALQLAERERDADSSAALDYITGNLLLQLDQPDAARSAYTTALEKFPSFVRARRNLGLLEIGTGNYAAAATQLRQSIQQGGPSAESYGLLGYAHLNLGNNASARTAYEQAVLLQPDNRDWRTGLTQALLRSDATDEAAAVLEELIRDYPDDPLLWQFEANLNISRGLEDQAITALEVARRLSPLTSDALYQLGDLYYRQDMPEMAVTNWIDAQRQASSPRPERTIQALTTLASNHQWQLFNEFLDASPQRTLQALTPRQQLTLRYLKARRDWHNGELESASDAFAAIIEEKPTHARSLLALATILLEQGDDDQRALLLLERAERDPDTRLNALLLQARIHVADADFSAALKALDQAVSIEDRDDIRRYRNAVRQAEAGMR